MGNKKNSYISTELQWLEDRAMEIKKDVDSHPYHKIKDRIVKLATATGVSEKVSATAESQKKAMREALKEYAQLLEMIDKLREKEEAKIESRGNGEISSLAEQFLQNRK